MSKQQCASAINDILTKAGSVLGCFGIHNFEDTRWSLLCHGVETHWSDDLLHFVKLPVEQLQTFGVFVSVDPIDNRRAFWLDRDDRDEHQKLINGR